MLEDRRKSGPNRRLDSWKEIASYFGRDERTLKRWEKDRGLPVRRLPGARGGVYAFTDDLAQWMSHHNRGLPESGEHVSPQPANPTAHEHAPEPAVAQSKPSIETTALPPISKKPSRTQMAWLLAAGLLVLLVALLVGDQKRGRESNPSASAHSQPAASKHVPAPAAQDSYLQGRYYWNKRTPDDLKRALRYFEQAVAQDPDYALAYVGLADCYNLLREYAAMPEDEAYRKAIDAARRAVELDPSLAEAHNSLAFDLFFGMLKKKDAEQEFLTALKLNPNCELAHHWYATYLMTVGRSSEALQHIEIARQLNSSSRSILADKGLILFYAGHTDEAKSLLKQLEDTEPSFISPHRYLALIYLVNGKFEEYLVESKKVAVLSRNETDLVIVNAAAKGFHHGGQQGMLTAMLAEQQKAFAKGELPAFRLAETLSLLGQKQQAMAYLRTSFERHETNLSSLTVDPLLTNLHDDPSYQQLAIHVGLG